MKKDRSNIIKLYEDQKISIYKIQKDLGLKEVRLYRYAEKKIPIDKMPAELILQLSNYLKIEPNLLFRKMKEYLK